MSSASVRTRVYQVVEPLVRDAGWDLEEVAVTPVGRRRLVRVVVDTDGGLDLDHVAELSRAVSVALDGLDALSGAYVLEVGTPGVDRPLTTPRHWRRARGRLVEAGLAGGGAVTGRIVAADDETVTIDLGGAERRLTYPELGRGRVHVEFHQAEGEAGTR